MSDTVAEIPLLYAKKRSGVLRIVPLIPMLIAPLNWRNDRTFCSSNLPWYFSYILASHSPGTTASQHCTSLPDAACMQGRQAENCSTKSTFMGSSSGEYNRFNTD